MNKIPDDADLVAAALFLGSLVMLLIVFH